MIRIWMTPTDLGEAGYSVDIPKVVSVHKTRSGDLILHAEAKNDDEHGEEIGRAAAGRWDCFVFLDEPTSRRPKRGADNG
jgi:hypothetical protein